MPVNTFGYAVYNENNEFCGCIVFGLGANNNLAKSLNCNQGEIIELVRMALNGKQESTSKALSISLRLIKKDIPLCKAIISYADESQNHKGIIYQATNWLYLGESISHSAIDPEDNKIKHTRILFSKYGTTKGLQYVQDKPKHKYIYIYSKEIKKIIEGMIKKYPKNAVIV